MKRGLLIAGGVVVLAAILVASILSGRKQSDEQVYVETAVRQALTQSIKSSGQIQPRIRVNISAHVIGKIEKLYAVEGAAIAAGAPFLELEREAFLAERDNARAQLAMAKTDLDQARVSAADEKVQLARAEELQTQGISSVEALEMVRRRHTTADLEVHKAREAVTQAQALLDKAEDDLRKTTIYAPLSGRVIALNAEVGEVVVSGTMNNEASVIGTIADLSEILAEIDVDETEVVHLARNQKVVLKVDAIAGREYAGRVVEIGSSGYAKASQPDVTFFKAKVLFDAPDEKLRPGMSARAEIQVATHAKALVVPIQAVVERTPKTASGSAPAKKAVVFVVTAGKAKSVPVETGISDATEVEITSGLAGGEHVITGPYRVLRKLEDGDAVKVTTPANDKGSEKESAKQSAKKESDTKSNIEAAV
jgi:HlyD family secretion protein